MMVRKKIKIITLHGNKIGGTEKAASALKSVLSKKHDCDIEFAFDEKIKKNITKFDQLVLIFRILFNFTASDIYITTDYATYCIVLFANFFKTKFNRIIMWEHIPKDRNGRFWLFLEQLFSLSNRADVLVTLSELERNKWQSKDTKKIIVIGNAIDVRNDIPSASDFFYRDGLVYVGRITKDKGVERLIEAFIEARNLNTVLKIVGDGDQLQMLKNKYSKQENIVFLGQMTDVSEILSQSAVFVSGSYYECFPISILEAMSRSLPIVSFDQSGGTESVISKAGCGFIVSTNKEFSEKVSLLIKEKHYIEFGQRGSKFVIENYAPEKYFNDWMSVIDGL